MTPSLRIDQIDAMSNSSFSPKAKSCGTVEVNINHYPEGSTGPALAALLEKIDRLEAKIVALAVVVTPVKKGKGAKIVT